MRSAISQVRPLAFVCYLKNNNTESVLRMKCVGHASLLRLFPKYVPPKYVASYAWADVRTKDDQVFTQTIPYCHRTLTQDAIGKHIFEHSPVPNFIQICHVVSELLIAYKHAELRSDANAPKKETRCKLESGVLLMANVVFI